MLWAVPLFAQSLDCSGICTPYETNAECIARYPKHFLAGQENDSEEKRQAPCGAHMEGYSPHMPIHHLVVGGTRNLTALSIQNGGPGSVIVRDFSVHGGTKNSTVSGVCPLFQARDNSKFFDMELTCTNPGEPAIEIRGKNVVIQNVKVPRNQFLVRAIDDYHIDVGTLSVSGSTGTAVFANIGSGSVTVECTDDNRFDSLVVIQRANNFVDPGSCPVVSLDAILNPLGTQYEIDYINRNAEVTPLQEIFRWGLFALVGLFVALFLYTIVSREKQLREMITGAEYFRIKKVLATFDDSVSLNEFEDGDKQGVQETEL